MSRTRIASNVDSSFGSKGYWGASVVALLLAAGCSAGGNQQQDQPGLNLGGAAGTPAVGTTPVGAGGVAVGVGAGGSTSVTQPPPTQTYTGTCPASIFTQCKACHDGNGTAGTPMGLVYWEDFHAPSPTNPSQQIYQILSARLHSTTPTPMPPQGQLDAATLATIDAWTQAGAPDCAGFTNKPGATGTGGASSTGAGGTSNPGGGAAPGVGGSTIAPPGGGGTSTGTGGTTGAPPGMAGSIDPSYLSADGSYFVKAPPGNTPVGPDAAGADYCFNVLAHGTQMPLTSDTSPFSVKASEFYHDFQQKVPYTKPFWAVSTKPIIDNNKVLHHWLLFQMGSPGTDGSNTDEIGLQLNNAMLTGWAPGGNPLDMPAGVGLEMPAVGGYLLIEFHYYNTTGTTQQDRSGVRICGTYTQPTNPASLTWLGTESINIPANSMGTATGNCTTWKKSGDVHFLQTVPHMHKLGTHMKTVINRSGGGQDILVDQPFEFSDQRAYAIDIVAHAQDTFTTTCTWMNTTSAAVSFGTSTTAEMCYNFVVYYPAHALDGVGGIEGSSNMCLF
ncbi:MAG TPA: hypothetical protein VHC69_12585 [Polyangiaceae bacterium]|nr:hypothetical protein [Polyangiaceae bacterium]